MDKKGGDGRQRRRGRLTRALIEESERDPTELARLIIQMAREGNSTALRLWAQYIQDPDTVTQSNELTEERVYGATSDSELELLLSRAEEIVNASYRGGTSANGAGERAAAAD